MDALWDLPSLQYKPNIAGESYESNFLENNIFLYKQLDYKGLEDN